MKKLLLALGLLAPIAADAQPVVPPIGTAALVCAFSASPPALASGTFAYVQCDSSGNILVNQNFPGSAGFGVGAFSAVPVAAGSSYAVGDTVTLTCPGATQNSQYAGAYNNVVLLVSDVSAGGITATFIQQPGSFSRIPTNPLSCNQSATSGIGVGATFNVSFATQAAYLLPPNQTNGSVSSINENFCAGYRCLFNITTGNENTAFGWQALFNDTTGNFNTAFGVNAMGTAHTTGSNNVAVGTDALRNSVSDANNIGIGVAALKFPTAVSFNVAIGTNSYLGQATSSGGSNVSIGYNSLSSTSLTTATQLVIIGANAGSGIVSSSNTTCVGFNTCQGAMTGGSNTGIGTISLQSVVGGGGNTGVGFSALQAVTAGSDNTAVGNTAATSATGAQNTVVGSKALTASSGVNNSTIIGYNAGHAVTGSNNTLIGASVASATLTTGARNIIIGTASTCDAPASSTSDLFAICNSTTSTYLMSGSVAAGSQSLTINTNGTFDITGILSSTAAQTGYLCWSTTNGAVTFDPSNTCLVSSERFKEDIHPLEGSLAKVLSLRPVSFHYRDRAANPDLHVGYLAENVAEVDPRFVIFGEDGKPLKVRLQEIPALAVGAIQELEKRLEALENRPH